MLSVGTRGEIMPLMILLCALVVVVIVGTAGGFVLVAETCRLLGIGP